MLLNSKVDTKLAIGFLLILTFGAISLINNSYELTKQEFDFLNQEQPMASTQLLREALNQKVLYRIDEGNGRIISIFLAASADSTVFSLLEKMSQKQNFAMESKEYKGMGVLVESIDGIKNGTDDKYWQYWVNGELPMVSADKKQVKSGDKVEWRFDKADF